MWNLSVLKMPTKRAVSVKKHFVKVKPRGSVLVSAPRKRPILKFGGLVKKPAFNLSSLFKPPAIKLPQITLPGQDVFPDETPDTSQIVGPGQDIVKSVPEGPVEEATEAVKEAVAPIKEKMKGICEKLGIPCWAMAAGGLTVLWLLFK